VIIRFRELYNSMNMSRDSTSLKKSSGDCLELAKQRYIISSGSVEALVRYGGKL